MLLIKYKNNFYLEIVRQKVQLKIIRMIINIGFGKKSHEYSKKINKLKANNLKY